MRREHLDVLRCPLSGERLSLEESEAAADGHVISGALVSSQGRFPIEGGVPRFVLEQSPEERRTVSAFGQQWQEAGSFSWTYGQTDAYFRDYFHPLSGDDLSRGTVLDAGCGNGRLVEYCLRFRPRLVVGLDYSASAEIAFRRTRHEANVLIVQGSILAPPLRTGAFDVVYSLGVIHHLDSPRDGVRQLGKILRDSGRMHLWTYSREGNEAYLSVALPLRRVLRNWPSVAKRALSGLAAVSLWPYLWLCHALGSRAAKWRLPMSRYMAFLYPLGIRVLALVVHDQLAPAIAHYPTRSELLGWCEDETLEIAHLDMRTGNSWRAGIRKRAS